MSQHTDMIEARKLLNIDTDSKNKISSLYHNFADDHWRHTLIGGKSFKVFEDKRRKDEIITEHLK